MSFNLSLLNQWIEERAGNIIQLPIERDGSLDYFDKVTNVSGQVTKLPIIDTDVTASTDPCNINETGQDTIKQFTITTTPFNIHKTWCLQELKKYFATQWLPTDSEMPKEFAALDTLLENALLKVALKQTRQVWMSDTGVTAFPNDFKAFDGLIKQLQTNVPSGNQNTLASGQTITTSNIISVMDAVISKLPVYTGQELVVFVPAELVRILTIALRNANYFHYTADPQLADNGVLKPFYYPGTEVLIVPTSGLNSNAVPSQPLSKKQCIYATYRGNLTLAYNISLDEKEVFYDKYHKQLVMDIQYEIGAGVKDYTFVSEFHLTP